MDWIKNAFPTHMDFVGQKQAERIFQVIILACGIVGFVVGYVTQQFSYSVYTLIGGFVLSCLIVLPPWPAFRKHPISWLKSDPSHPETKKVKKN